MWRAQPSRLLALIALTTVAAHPARPGKEDAARHEIERAERARAAETAAQQNAVARAAQAAAETERLAAERIAAAARLRQAENETAGVVARIDVLAAKRREAEAALAARAETMQPLLPLIERLSLFPAETLLAVPASAEDTLRGVLVLRGLAGQLGQEAVALRREQAALDAATRALEAERPRLVVALAAQKAQADGLDRQIAVAEAGRRQAEGDATAAAQRGASEAARAESLRGVLTELEAQRRAELAQAREDAARAERQRREDDAAAARQRQAALARPAGGSFGGGSQPRGRLTAPVAGSIIRAWGAATEAGPASGVSYQAPPGARVVSVCTGRVAFSAPFRSYGKLLIIDCGGGYHVVLAGFDRLDAKAGQDVAAGEPVGVMPGWEPGTSAGRPSLYVELRRDGQPVNPTPWLRASS